MLKGGELVESSLSDLIQDWDPRLGESLRDLAEVGVEELKSILETKDKAYAGLVWGLRSQAQDLIRSSEREHALSTPAQIDAALRDGVLKPRPSWWIVYPLDTKMRRIAAPYKSGGSRFKVDLKKKFPTPDQSLVDTDNGSHLVLWGGSPEVLQIPGVLERIVIFSKSSALKDVIFWDADSRSMWSLRFGIGQNPKETLDIKPYLGEMKGDSILWR